MRWNDEDDHGDWLMECRRDKELDRRTSPQRLSDRAAPFKDAMPWVLAEIRVLENQLDGVGEMNVDLYRLLEEQEQDVTPLVYCELCGSCGEDGCCPPERCLLRKAEAERDRYREAFAAERETRQNIESRLAALEGDGDE